MPDIALPRYAVVIPTRNRAETCVEAVRTAAAAGRADVEIVVPDASDDPTRLPGLLAAAGLSGAARLLPPPERRLSMRENWERGLAAAQADWIIFIGDDDALLPNAFGVLDAFTAAARSPVIAWEPIEYRWPCYPDATAGQLVFSTAAPTLRSCDAETQLLQHFAWRTRRKWPAIGPSIYHGAVHRELVERVRARHGAYFLSFIVDYASAIANLAEIRAYPYFTGALSVLGASARSNSAGLSANGEGAKRYDDVIAENPGLAPLHPGLAASRLHAPLVAAGYRQVFAALGAEFALAPEKMIRSCVDELGLISNPEAFERERETLLDFAAASGVSDAPIRAARSAAPRVLVGHHAESGTHAVDTLRLGWRNAADAAAGVGAFISALAPEEAEAGLARAAG